MYCSTGAVIILSWWPRRSDCAAGQKAERGEERTWRERGGKRITPCVYTFFSLVWGERGVCKRNPLWVMIYRPEFPLNTAEREGKPPLIFPNPPPTPLEVSFGGLGEGFASVRSHAAGQEYARGRCHEAGQEFARRWRRLVALQYYSYGKSHVHYLYCIVCCNRGGDIASFYGRQSLNNG